MENKNIEQGTTILGDLKTVSVTGAVAKKIIVSSDTAIANAVVRTVKAVEERKDSITKKSLNFGVAVGAKMLSNMFVPNSSVIDTITNGALLVTGVSLALEANKVKNTALSYTDEEVKKELDALVADNSFDLF